MKKVLLDTHIFLWWLADNRKLSKKIRALIGDEKNFIYVSAISAWEIAIKKAQNKLKAPGDLGNVIEEEGFVELPITVFHAEQAGSLPPIHRDPFDRMLIAQAQAEGLELVTTDETLRQYGIRIYQ